MEGSKSMSQNKVLKVIQFLSDLEAKDLDNESIQHLCQLMYKMKQVESMIFIKTIGRLSCEVERLEENLNFRIERLENNN
jgi:hypothetical protein